MLAGAAATAANKQHHKRRNPLAQASSTLAHSVSEQKAQAVFAFATIFVVILQLFSLAPRLAFTGDPFGDPFSRTMFFVPLLLSVVFVGVYVAGAWWFHENKKKDTETRQQMEIVESVRGEAKKQTTEGLFELDNPLVMFSHLIVANVVPFVADWSSLRGPPRLKWVGLLRLIQLLWFAPVFHVLETNLTVPYWAPPTAKNLLLLLGTTEYAACLFWMLARWKGFSEDTWVGAHAPDLVDASSNTQFIHSLYFAVITASTVGYGDFYPVSLSEMTVMICYVLINVLLVANIVGGISALASMADTDLAEQRMRISRFERMLKIEGVSDDVSNATREYLRLGLKLVHLDERCDVDSLPASVRFRIREERFGKILTELPLFHGVSQRFKAKCIALAKDDAFVKGLDLTREGDLATRLCVVIQGHASVVVDGAPVAILHTGATFGAESFVCGMHEPWTIVATSLLRVVSLDDHDRRQLQADFPNDWFKVRDNLSQSIASIKHSAQSLLENHEDAKDDPDDANVHLFDLSFCLKAPPALVVDPAALASFVQLIQLVQDFIRRDALKASHELAALHCHVASHGDEDQLRSLINMVPVTIVKADYDGRTALHLAAANGHTACVELLLRAGADANAKDRFDRTPLAEAVLNGHNDCITVLVNANARLQLSTQGIAERLCAAAHGGDLALIRRYLDAGAPPDATDYDKRTALMLAAACGSLPIVELLVDRGADPALKDRWGHDAAQEATFHGHTGNLLAYLNDHKKNPASK